MTRNRITLAALATLAVAFAWIWNAQADDDTQSPVPEAVMAALRTVSPEGKIAASDSGHLAALVYEIHVMDGDSKTEVLIGADGTILRLERDIARADLPAAVEKALAGAAGDAAVEDIERLEQRAELGFVATDGAVVFEAEFKRDGKEFEVKIAADGTVISIEEEDDDDDDDDDGHDDDDDDDDDDEHGGDHSGDHDK